MAARAITAPELERLRRDGQWSKLYLTIDSPPAVYTARVAIAPPSNDSVAEVQYNNGAGNLGDVLPGMTMLVGTSAGIDDVGRVRIRAVPSGTTFYIGETSEIAWSSGLYLTVLDEFSIWPRHPRLSGTTLLIDWDIAYTNQHAICQPYPVLGSDAIAILQGGQAVVQFDASGSFCPEATVTGYSWSAPGAASISGGSSATPSITYTSPGRYRVSCVVTASNGASAVGYRYVWVYSELALPNVEFKVGSIQQDRNGWSFSATVFSEVKNVRDRARVILWAVDYYGAERISMGPVTGRENIVASGWIWGESIRWGADYSTVSFEVLGPAGWLEASVGFPLGIEDTDYSDNGGGAPNRWTEFEDLTVDKALWHVLVWRTNASQRIDARLTGDSRQTPAVSTPASSAWSQLTEVANQILAAPKCDRYGALYVSVDAQLIPPANRSSIPVVMTLTKQDWEGEIYIERRVVGEIAQVNLSGISYYNGITSIHCAQAHGTIFRHAARSVIALERLLLSNGAQAAELAGLYIARENNPFPSVSVTIPANNRFLDTAPSQFVTISMAANDTPRGISWHQKRFLVRRCSYLYSEASNAFRVQVELEAETTGSIAMVTQCPGAPEPEPQEAPAVTSPTWPLIPGGYPGILALAAVGGGVYISLNFKQPVPTWTSRPGLPSEFTTSDRIAVSGGAGVLIASHDPVPQALGTVWRLTDLESGTWQQVSNDGDLLAAAQQTDATIARIEIGYAAKDPNHPTRLVIPFRGYNALGFLVRFGLLISTDGNAFSGGASVAAALNASTPITGFARAWYGAGGRVTARFYFSSVFGQSAGWIVSADNGATSVASGSANGVQEGFYPFWRGARTGSSLRAVAYNDGQMRYANDYGVTPANANAPGYTPTEPQTDSTGAIAASPTTNSGFVFYSADGGVNYVAKAAPGGIDVRGMSAFGPNEWVAWGNGLLSYCADLSRTTPVWISKLAGLPNNDIVSLTTF